MQHPSSRDPLDGPPPKWIRRKSDPSETSAVDPWAHIPGIKRSSSLPHTSSSPNHQEHISVSSVVREKVTEQTSPQLSASSTPENSDAHKPTVHERFIANQLLKDSDMDELCTACSDPS